MRLGRIVAGVGLPFLMATSVLAQELTVVEFARRAENEERFLLRIEGAAEGLQVANIQMEREGKTKLYCTSGSLLLTSDQLRVILVRYAEKNPVKGTWPAGMYGVALLDALAEVFPCP
ncbi:hypothetical protein [Pararhizobium qamdonense]|uniref:hypothetical protein n=1 Tax=Pararhizobium qamdonense TaxID=3031126 RepID=UPI0023E0B9B3|nr:hypothetical protein [Pararhizobium qamdonense]